MDIGIKDGAPYVEDAWWEGFLAMIIGVVVVLALPAVIVGVRWLLGLEGPRS
jgi:hypothetical protein